MEVLHFMGVDVGVLLLVEVLLVEVVDAEVVDVEVADAEGKGLHKATIYIYIFCCNHRPPAKIFDLR